MTRLANLVCVLVRLRLPSLSATPLALDSPSTPDTFVQIRASTLRSHVGESRAYSMSSVSVVTPDQLFLLEMKLLLLMQTVVWFPTVVWLVASKRWENH